MMATPVYSHGTQRFRARLEEMRGGVENIRGEQLPVGTRAIAARANVTPETLMDELEQARALAMDSKQPSAAVSATKEKSILSGHRIERSEVGGPGEFDHLTDAELETAVRDRLVELGFLPPDAGSDRRH